MTKISIVGGAGFVGTNLCRYLSDRQIDFEIIDLKKSKSFPDRCKIGDVRDLESLRQTISGQVVVHLAAVHRDDIRDKSEYTRTNILGTENIAKVCAEKDIQKIVFTSTVAVYGFATPETDEKGIIAPFNEYGRTKFAAEEKLRAWQSSTPAASLIIVRPTVIFGEGNRGNVFNLLNQVATGRFVMVGHGRNRKSMAYIANVVSFLDACIRSDLEYGLFNYVDKPDFDMNALVGQVRKVLRNREDVGLRVPYSIGLFLGYLADGFAVLTGKSLPLSSIRVRKFCATTSFSTAKENLDGFKPPFSLSEGIDRTLKSEFIEPDPEREIFYTE